MDFYLSIGGAKKGPFSHFKVGDLLESGEADVETLAWHRDLEGWKPIREISALDVVVERARPTEASAPPQAVSPDYAPLPSSDPERPTPPPLPLRATPFLRFWARMFDYLLVSVVVFQFSDVEVPQPVPGETAGELFSRYVAEMQRPESLRLARTLFLALIGWHFIEAVLLHLVGTTPGKALFGLKYSAREGGAVPMLRSLGRSFYVYVMGAGLYQFPFILIGMVFSFFRIAATGQSLWDQHLRIRVENSSLGTVRIMLAIGAFLVLLLLQSVKV